ASHKKSKALATIAAFDADKNPNSGIAGGRIKIKADGRIEEFVEGGELKNASLVNGGIYAFEPQIFPRLPEGNSDFGRDVFPALLKKGAPLFTYKMEGYCLGLDTPEAYARAQQIAA